MKQNILSWYLVKYFSLQINTEERIYTENHFTKTLLQRTISRRSNFQLVQRFVFTMNLIHNFHDIDCVTKKIFINN